MEEKFERRKGMWREREREERKVGRESNGGEEKELQRGTWESRESEERTPWDDRLDEETVPLLDDQTGQTFRDWVPPALPDPWNNSFGNPFGFDEWKPLPDPLAEGRPRR